MNCFNCIYCRFQIINFEPIVTCMYSDGIVAIECPAFKPIKQVKRKQ